MRGNSAGWIVIRFLLWMLTGLFTVVLVQEITRVS